MELKKVNSTINKVCNNIINRDEERISKRLSKIANVKHRKINKIGNTEL